MRAIALVRSDLVSGRDLDNLHALAHRLRLDLSDADIHITSNFAVLLAQLADPRPEVILSPAEPHLRGWMSVTRCITHVVTVTPLLWWPQLASQPRRTLPPIPLFHNILPPPGQIWHAERAGRESFLADITQTRQSHPRESNTPHRLTSHIFTGPAV